MPTVTSTCGPGVFSSFGPVPSLQSPKAAVGMVLQVTATMGCVCIHISTANTDSQKLTGCTCCCP